MIVRLTTGARRKLRWIAIGTALGCLASVVPWATKKATEEETFYVLAYSRNTGMDVWPDRSVGDPGPAVDSISDYPVQIAIRCRISPWSISSNVGANDVDETAWLRIRADVVDDRVFNCLSQFVRPPFVRISRGSKAALRKARMFGN